MAEHQEQFRLHSMCRVLQVQRSGYYAWKAKPESKRTLFDDERTHSWFNRFRGLLVRWAKKAENYLAFLHLVCGIIAWRATGLLG